MTGLYVVWGTLVDQERLLAGLKATPGDWEEQSADKGKPIVIRTNAQSEYLRWVRKEIVDAYGEKIDRILVIKW